MSEEAFRKELEIIARVLVANPMALRAVKQDADCGVNYAFEDMATNQTVRLANIIRLGWEFAKSKEVPVRLSEIQDMQTVSLSQGNIPSSLIYYWKDEYWGICKLPGPFEIKWKIKPHKKTGENLYAIPLKDFSIIMNYAGKSNKEIKIS